MSDDTQLEPVASEPAAAVPPSRSTLIVAAGLASLGAGAIHATAVGAHAEHRSAAIAFTVVAALQLCWGGLALVRAGRAVAVSGLLLGAAAVAGWALAKSSGISFIEGLDESEPLQTADALAAGLALGGGLLAASSLRAPRTIPRSSASLPLSLLAGGVATLAVIGMVTAGTHAHSGGDEGHVEVAGASNEHEDGHEHATSAEPTDDEATHEHDVAEPAAEGHEHMADEPVPYDPTKPLDFSGVAGVTPEQQAAAENLVAVTLVDLPQWADPAVAEAAGFFSIGDGLTGIEHFLNNDYINDDIILDPDRPESLVYSTEGGSRRLVAAMYMVERGMPLEEVPNVGGALMQWHIHNDLCFQENGRLGGLVDGNGNCAPPLIKFDPTPMIHVWIEPHPCGPFAALEGIGGGQILEGEERLCDRAHGDH